MFFDPHGVFPAVSFPDGQSRNGCWATSTTNRVGKIYGQTPIYGIKPALPDTKGGASTANQRRMPSMGLSAILIATALSLTMLVAVTDMPID
jgi:hypothetical protein